MFILQPEDLNFRFHFLFPAFGCGNRWHPKTVEIRRRFQTAKIAKKWIKITENSIFLFISSPSAPASCLEADFADEVLHTGGLRGDVLAHAGVVGVFHVFSFPLFITFMV